MLLSVCDEKAAATFRNSMTSPRQVRTGIAAAHQIIESEPPGSSAVSWLEAVLSRFERQRTLLNQDPDDEDGWSLGGLRTIQNFVEERLEAAKKAPPEPPLSFAEWLRKKMTGS